VGQRPSSTSAPSPSPTPIPAGAKMVVRVAV
jgi:hypothetical protein